MKESFAVAEVKLQPGKEDTDNEAWTKLLFPDTVKEQKDLKHAELYLKVVATENTFTVRSSEEFLKDKPFVLSTYTCGCQRCVTYQDVWENPEISKGNTSLNKNRYKKAKRYRASGKVYYHKGIDIHTGPIYKELHSLLCGEVVFTENSFITNKYKHDSLGNVITVKSNDKDGNVIYIMYCHLDKVYVKKGDKVIHRQKIALSGSTGNAAEILNEDGTLKNGIHKENWHVHIEAATTYVNAATMHGQARKDPELFMKTKFDSDGKPIQ